MGRDHEAVLPGSAGLRSEHLSMMRATRLSVFLKPWPCLIATFILLFTASTRALEAPSAMERRIPSRLRLTFLGMLDAYLRWYRDVRIKGDLDYRSPMQYRRDLGLLAA